MNIEEYIASGIVETYALGLCSPQEAAELEKLCAQHPSLKAAVIDAQQALENYAALHERKPAASVKANLDAMLDFAEPPIESKKIRLFNPYTVAAAILLMSSVALNVLLYVRLQHSNSELLAALSRNQQMADNLKGNQVKLSDLNTQLSVLTNPEYNKILLKGTPQTPSSLVSVFWNKNSTEVFVSVNNLPKPAVGKQYQLWAIVGGKPQDAGLLPLDEVAALIQMKSFGEADAFAITLEDAGGAESPTLSQLCVIGNVSG
ncbi:MAG: anti-sigma factor [Bacteroidetes bacterium]|nr:MAG: anti-sigma factor [Bacteroidota bacterium]